ncbi:MAG: serine/threonine-protein phosphatase [Ruminococcaceae bacterium]|nr:serine/threonine-protein phosphatase [Oscillospiraceae bacterium]
MISYKAAVASAPGGKNAHNEDNFYFNTRYLTEDLTESQVLLSHKKNQRGLQIYAVYDGSNGDTPNEEASLILAKNLLKYHKKLVDNPSCDVPQTINEYIASSNEKVNVQIQQLMGKNIYSTLALLCVERESTLICSVGDSRVYSYINGELTQITEDHTQAQRMVQLGLLTPEKASSHVKREKLTQYFGSMPAGMTIKPFMETMISNNGDTFVLCTKGFYDAVPEKIMSTVLAKRLPPADTVDELMAYAMDKGIKNDATVIIVTACDNNKSIAPLATATTTAVSASETPEVSTLFAHDDELTAAENAKQSYEEYSENYDDSAEDVDSFIGKLLSPFRRGGTRDLNEFWPALIIFAVCILAVVVLSVFGYNLFLRNRDNAGMPTYIPGTTATVAPKPTPGITILPDGTIVTAAPNSGGMIDPDATPDRDYNSDGETSTEEPTETPTTAPEATPVPTGTATSSPSATPNATEEPAEPTEAPTEEPEVTPTAEPAEPTEAPTEAPAEPTPAPPDDLPPDFSDEL